MNRRIFLKSFPVALLLPNFNLAGQFSDDIFIGAAKQDNSFFIAAFNRKGKQRYTIKTKARTHDIVLNPKENIAAVFARRPGNFILILETISGRILRTITSAENRYFYGHGLYSQDGQFLFATSNNKINHQGLITVYDVKDNYKKLTELNVYGLGPHQMAILSDGRTAAICVGGMKTQNRRVQNLDSMQPSLNYIDLFSGKLLGKYKLANNLHQISIRHLSVAADDTISFACQDQAKGILRSLVGFHKGQNVLSLAYTPQEILKMQKAYCGSVVNDYSNKFAAVSSPKGNIITIWDITKQYIIQTLQFQDSCGIASTSKSAEFVFSSGLMGCMIFNVLTKKQRFIDTSFVLNKSWDNHLTSLKI